MTDMTEGSRPTWVDLTVRFAEDAEIELERQPNGDIEYTIPIPELGSSRITFVIPAAVAKRVNTKVRELLLTAPAVALALVS